MAGTDRTRSLNCPYVLSSVPLCYQHPTRVLTLFLVSPVALGNEESSVGYLRFPEFALHLTVNFLRHHTTSRSSPGSLVAQPPLEQ